MPRRRIKNGQDEYTSIGVKKDIAFKQAGSAFVEDPFPNRIEKLT